MKRSPAHLTHKQINALLKKHADWKVTTAYSELYKTYVFKDYVSGLVFIARISVHAEILNHYPIIEFAYGKVKVRLSTHEAKGITKRDTELLERIERLPV